MAVQGMKMVVLQRNIDILLICFVFIYL